MLNTDLISYLANLSKIEVEDADKEKLVSEMSAIVELMDAMNEVTIEDDLNLNGEGISLSNLREDEVVESFNRELVLANASHKKDGFFVVPKIME
ncbi:Asp-tRNA(Asn)/Glu-tRNA(Gln) amidotransferase subunit GatC [Cellulosilyticum ruminicola]|uniref:Asp-tRNA(Asn)/Glu-tRNA(Gln) amidotransferase subunit GatC n=1 Tax=Cellulosilyticum ruminicola TaxID=425254 RepID=UPI0006CF674A|nr:Asp-tRNA(Asn)/Glu-tRNA(Gln) amidotransferase subunit GatC [Cellulosilyticum ruminicola]